MSLSLKEQKAIFRSVAKEILIEERDRENAKALKKLDEYMKDVETLTFHDLLDLPELPDEIEPVSLDTYSFPEPIAKYIQEKFQSELAELNTNVNNLLKPLREYLATFPEPKITKYRKTDQFGKLDLAHEITRFQGR